MSDHETGFSPGAGIVLEAVGDENWKLRESFSYSGKCDTYTVPVGAETDFASVPRLFVWFIPRYGRYTRAAVLHDYLWRQLAETERMSYLDADGLFRRALRDLEVSFLRRWIMWAAVRWAALMKPLGRLGWWREAPRVLLVTVVALPIVLPPAVVVGLALGAFFLLEGLLWAPLKLHAAAKRSRGTEEPKEVHEPHFDWRL